MDFSKLTEMLTTGGIAGAVVALILGVLKFILQTRSQDLTHIDKRYQQLIEDNNSFREEVRKDLAITKKEKQELLEKVRDLETQLHKLIIENLSLKKRETELSMEVSNLKRRLQEHENKTKE